MATVSEAKLGDIVRFKSYALRVEREPVLNGAFVVLHGRISVDGSPLVTRKFNSALECQIEAQRH